MSKELDEKMLADRAQELNSDSMTPAGWYYDDQQRIFDAGRLMTVSLHANSVYKTIKRGNGMYISEWSSCTPGKDQDDHYPWGHVTRDGECSLGTDQQTPDNSIGYFMEPLCTSLMNEDFSVTVQNSWSEMGGDMIGGLWNKAKQYAAVMPALMEAGGDLITKVTSSFIDGNKDKTPTELENSPILNAGIKLAGLVKGIGQWATKSDNQEMVSDYLNRSMVMQGTRFSYYEGTAINFGNLSMRFTILPQWKKIGGKMKFFTVPAQVKELYPYFVGEYIDEPLFNGLRNGLNEFIGWQCPPGGYRAALKDVDNVQRGTLKLKFGTLYSVSNLVVDSCQFNFSRECVKCPDPDTFVTDELVIDNTDQNQKIVNISGLLSPLYCDVVLNLRPVTKFSSQSLRKFFNSHNIARSKSFTEMRIFKRLESGIKTTKSRYKTARMEAIDADNKIKDAREKKAREDAARESMEKAGIKSAEVIGTISVSDARESGLYSEYEKKMESELLTKIKGDREDTGNIIVTAFITPENEIIDESETQLRINANGEIVSSSTTFTLTSTNESEVTNVEKYLTSEEIEASKKKAIREALKNSVGDELLDACVEDFYTYYQSALEVGVTSKGVYNNDTGEMETTYTSNCYYDNASNTYGAKYKIETDNIEAYLKDYSSRIIESEESENALPYQYNNNQFLELLEDGKFLESVFK